VCIFLLKIIIFPTQSRYFKQEIKKKVIGKMLKKPNFDDDLASLKFAVCSQPLFFPISI